MKIFTDTRPCAHDTIRTNTLYFDIETTGFIRTASHTYMIGLFYREDADLHLRFLFAENESEERTLLLAFIDILDTFDTVATFNGNRFDIPYLEWRASVLGVPLHFTGKDTIDMYRDFRPLKKMFGLSSMRQKSLEAFLGFKREDPFDGGTLIPLYREYARTGDERLARIITLHNINDIEGMAEITRLYAYLQCIPKTTPLRRDEADLLHLEVALRQPVPVPITRRDCGVVLHLSNHRMVLTLPVRTGPLRYYFKNWRDYYRIPDENLCVHKSVGTLVDRSRREPATADTAYVRQAGRFIPQPTADCGRSYVESRRAKRRWLHLDELDDDTALLLMQAYLQQITGV